MPARIRKIKTSPLISTLPMLDKEKLLESVFRINAYMTNQPNLDEILSKILDEVVDTIGFDRAIIRLFDETKRYLIISPQATGILMTTVQADKASSITHLPLFVLK